MIKIPSCLAWREKYFTKLQDKLSWVPAGRNRFVWTKNQLCNKAIYKNRPERSDSDYGSDPRQEILVLVYDSTIN